MRHWLWNRPFFQRMRCINVMILVLISLIAFVGFAVLYSAGGGNLHPWAEKQMLRFLIGIVLMAIVASVDIRFWFRNAYFFYFFAMSLLILVEIVGMVGMGAQRWINLYFFNLQPSEIMKIAIVLAIARYFYNMQIHEIRKLSNLLPAFLMVIAPAGLVMRQPDLGTAIVLTMVGGMMIYYAGLPKWIIVAASALVTAAMPVLWHFMHGYQRNRILTFLNPDRDPLGAGYHQLQSKIALGSGGVFGKGFLKGTQSHLNFLPEKQTDFVFTMYSEEFGFIGGLLLLLLYFILIGYGYSIADQCRHRFGSLLAAGINTILFVYVFINVAMVTGLLPVVGVPLPLVSYGGTSMLTVLIGIGFILCVDVQKNRSPGI